MGTHFILFDGRDARVTYHNRLLGDCCVNGCMNIIKHQNGNWNGSGFIAACLWIDGIGFTYWRHILKSNWNGWPFISIKIPAWHRRFSCMLWYLILLQALQEFGGKERPSVPIGFQNMSPVCKVNPINPKTSCNESKPFQLPFWCRIMFHYIHSHNSHQGGDCGK